MKTVTIAILTALAVISCKKKDDVESELYGTYKLIETLADPGDGSGTFQPVSSDKTVTLYNDGTITSNGELCRLNTETGTSTAGTYSFTDSTISSSDCTTFGFELSGNTLILNYQCIEACRGKFLKQ
ncbi:MAG: hypothetical protein NWS74_03095 [Salibacteraceae bacterium]|nr:hypothetical protein [Salibacteraceae bacterium]MDP4687299.1 hypothetical protein [Salibacteraceae bacterium]MDP4763626.1 hypothetical protein [Salibacteraceae bacterium]